MANPLVLYSAASLHIIRLPCRRALVCLSFIDPPSCSHFQTIVGARSFSAKPIKFFCGEVCSACGNDYSLAFTRIFVIVIRNDELHANCCRMQHRRLLHISSQFCRGAKGDGCSACSTNRKIKRISVTSISPRQPPTWFKTESNAVLVYLHVVLDAKATARCQTI